MVVVAADTEGNHLVVDEGNIATDGEAVVIEIDRTEDVVERIVGVELEGKVVLQEAVADFGVGFKFLADGPASVAGEVIMACGTIVGHGGHIGIDLSDGVEIVGVDATCGT